MEALLIVDFQNDFTPGGALPVAEGDRIAGPLAPLLDHFDLVIASRDWHPPDHGSFRGVEVDPAAWQGADPPSIWPVHCVQGTAGAELHPSLDRAKVDIVVDKGQDVNSQGCSAFQDTELGTLLRERGVDRLFIAGLATDYCVKNSVLDALREGFGVVVIEDAIRGLDVQPGDSERAVEEMRTAGAMLADSADVARTQPAGFKPDFLGFLDELSFTGDVRALPEGTVFFPQEPALELTAPLAEAQLAETLLVTRSTSSRCSQRRPHAASTPLAGGS
jgi:nicotinamidase/pyrazinamidase